KRRFVGDQKNEKVKKKKEEHSYSLSNRSLDFLNLKHLDRLGSMRYKTCLAGAIRKNRDEDIS
nr:hypothetical protein [Tanacetum cinerariifolium]